MSTLHLCPGSPPYKLESLEGDSFEELILREASGYVCQPGVCLIDDLMWEELDHTGEPGQQAGEWSFSTLPWPMLHSLPPVSCLESLPSISTMTSGPRWKLERTLYFPTYVCSWCLPQQQKANSNSCILACQLFALVSWYGFFVENYLENCCLWQCLKCFL